MQCHLLRTSLELIDSGDGPLYGSVSLGMEIHHGNLDTAMRRFPDTAYSVYLPVLADHGGRVDAQRLSACSRTHIAQAALRFARNNDMEQCRMLVSCERFEFGAFYCEVTAHCRVPCYVYKETEALRAVRVILEMCKQDRAPPLHRLMMFELACLVGDANAAIYTLRRWYTASADWKRRVCAGVYHSILNRFAVLKATISPWVPYDCMRVHDLDALCTNSSYAIRAYDIRQVVMVKRGVNKSHNMPALCSAPLFGEVYQCEWPSLRLNMDALSSMLLSDATDAQMARVITQVKSVCLRVDQFSRVLRWVINRPELGLTFAALMDRLKSRKACVCAVGLSDGLRYVKNLPEAYALVLADAACMQCTQCRHGLWSTAMMRTGAVAAMLCHRLGTMHWHAETNLLIYEQFHCLSCATVAHRSIKQLVHKTTRLAFRARCFWLHVRMPGDAFTLVLQWLLDGDAFKWCEALTTDKSHDVVVKWFDTPVRFSTSSTASIAPSPCKGCTSQ